MLTDTGSITYGGDKFFREIITAIRDRPGIIVRGVGHFLLDDKWGDVVDHLIEFMTCTSFQYSVIERLAFGASYGY
jgi:hypothetical protein